MLKYFGLSAIVVALDLYSKHLIQSAFAYSEMLTLTHFFDLVHYRNLGAAFGFLNDAGGWQKWFFTAISMVAVIVMAYLIRKHQDEKLFCWGLALVLGGALGNLYDRITLGYVVDFLNFHIGDYYWPAFNVADSAIVGGVGLLLLDSFKKPNK
ncbi:MAG: lipoprotein signal peptidase [Methylotenera sp.]|nr:lipoprotein signal peptidase [Methylotenera sp.]